MAGTGLGETIFNPTSFAGAQIAGIPAGELLRDSDFETGVVIPNPDDAVAAIFVLPVAVLTGRNNAGEQCILPLFDAVLVNQATEKSLRACGQDVPRQPTLRQARETAQEMNKAMRDIALYQNRNRSWARTDFSPEAVITRLLSEQPAKMEPEKVSTPFRRR